MESLVVSVLWFVSFLEVWSHTLGTWRDSADANLGLEEVCGNSLGAVGKAFTVQVWGPESGPQHPRKTARCGNSHLQSQGSSSRMGDGDREAPGAGQAWSLQQQTSPCLRWGGRRGLSSLLHVHSYTDPDTQLKQSSGLNLWTYFPLSGQLYKK